MKEHQILRKSMNFALSNKYLEVITQCLELRLFKEKIKVLYNKIK